MRDYLVAYQEKAGLTDTAFAQWLGVPRTTWIHIKNGKRALGLHTLRRISKAFPAIKQHTIAEFIGEEP